MSKKIKPVFEDKPTTQINNHQMSKAGEISQISSQNDIVNSHNVAQKVGPKTLTKEMIEKLESYDQLIEQNSILLREKDELTDKLGEYLSELKDLRDKPATINGNASLSIMISDLKLQNEQLQKTTDDYLLKISQLTFDNAKLMSQVQQLSKQLQTTSQSNVKNDGTITDEVPQFTQPEVKPDPYNPYVNNGYSEWS